MLRFLSKLLQSLSLAWLFLKSFIRFVRRRWGLSLLSLGVLFITFVSFAVTRPAKIEYVTAAAGKGDLRQIVEAVGTVISEKDLELQFSSIDVVARVHVKEGQVVKAGQKLAELRSGTLAASVAAARASVDSARAALRALQEGSRPEDIAIAEAQVANKRASLEAAKQTLANAEANLASAKDQLEGLQTEASVSLSGRVTAAGSTMSQQLATSKTALLTIRGAFNANDVQDAVVKGQVTGYDSLQANLTLTIDAISSLQAESDPVDYQQALASFAKVRSVVASTAELASRAYDIVSNLTITSSFTQTSKETNKSTVAVQKNAVQLALSALDAAAKDLQDASATFSSRIISKQGEVTTFTGTRDRSKADIATFQTSLQIDEASLALKRAPARTTDLDSAKARVSQAQADLARAAAQWSDTILLAPVDGIVTKVNVKQGEVRPSGTPSVTMLGTAPYRIELFVSEVDIPKVIVSASGSIKLDAFRTESLPIRVSEIDPAATNRDGVPKYRVKLDFIELKSDLKVGMTGDAEIVTGFRPNVVSVPLRSVIEKEGKKIVRIQQRDGTLEERSVTLGMEGEGGNVEVIGVREGETVIVLEKK